MSLGSVISTFVMCILFNIMLPSGDVGSDINLMYQTLKFDLGDSLELEGCKSCYRKTEREVYYPDKKLTSNACKTCLHDPYSVCGRYPPILKKIEVLKREKQICSSNETFKIDYYLEIKAGECNERKDPCCVTQTIEPKRENPIIKLDPKKLFSFCQQLTQELDFCFVSGKASGLYCDNLKYDPEFNQLRNARKMLVESSSTNETIFFYPYSKINET